MLENDRVILNIDGDYREEEWNGNKVISVDREVKTEYVTEYVEVPVPVPSVPEKEKPIQTEEPKQEVQEQPKPQEEAPQNEGGGYSMTVEATAYTNHPSENGSYDGRVLTKTGYDITDTIYYNGMRIIATDPNVIPTGSIVDIEGYGKAIALDTGGAIQGNRIDYLVGSDQEATNFGRRNVNVKIIGKG